MRIRFIKSVLRPLLFALNMLIGGLVQANTITYNALTDFPVIDAGEVPYYRDQARNALAINAANVNFRNRFAKAEVTFDGQPGIYQFVLVGLAELDGEADYRVTVNGNIVGLASNPEVVQDFTVVRHEFPDIELPSGAVIAVESLANSNSKIPENGEFAFARGRWTMLEVSSTPPIPDSPDLSVVAAGPEGELSIDQAFSIDATVTNSSSDAVATGVKVTVPLTGPELTLSSGSACTVSSTAIVCPAFELAGGESAMVSIPLQANAALTDVPITVSVSSDQTDHDEADNAVQLMLTVDSGSNETLTENMVESGVDGATGTNATIDMADVSNMKNGGGVWSLFSLLAGMGLVLIRVRLRAAFS